MSTPSLTRAVIARRALPAGRLEAVEQAQAAFKAFCLGHGLPPGEDAFLLHLTDLLLEQGFFVSARTIQTRLEHLNTAARLAGQQPWSGRPSIRRLLRGLHQIKPLGGSPLSLPIYPELVEDLVDAIMEPTHDQLRWRAAILLANDTGASALALHALHWEHLRMGRRHVDIFWPGPRCRHTRVEEPTVHAAAPPALVPQRRPLRRRLRLETWIRPLRCTPPSATSPAYVGPCGLGARELAPRA